MFTLVIHRFAPPMAKISTQTVADLLTHIGIVLALAGVLFLSFFFLYLPAVTHHGQTITVPDLARLSLGEMKTLLEDRNLRYEISDCTFVAGAEPLTVVGQYPMPNATVKENRKIYITLTRRAAPTIAMPGLLDMNKRSAELALLSAGLVLGEISYVPDRAKNSVLRQLVNGVAVAPGSPIAKGTKIDLELGDGLGNTKLPVPDVVGMPLDEARLLIRGSNLQIGVLVPVDDPDKTVGTVVRQKPEARSGETIRVGETIDLWVVGPLDAQEP
jgi:eukaryotic-like serine/threonine-protein kinase